MPPLTSAADLPAQDAWIATTAGLYAGEVTIRNGEHACLDELRSRGIIR